MAPKKAISDEQLELLIVEIRGRRVVLDADLARLYGASTKRFNEAFKRNRHRFPEDFAFRLTPSEYANLRSQFAISSAQVSDSLGGNWSQFATSWHRGHRYVPWAFTEHGVVHLREQATANTAILKRLAEIDKTLLQHDSALRDLYRKLLPLLQPPAEPRKRPIGFHTGNE